MRNIITPVQFERPRASSPKRVSPSDRAGSGASQPDTMSRSERAWRNARKLGVPVLPAGGNRELERKLTAPHWQPATNDRAYAQWHAQSPPPTHSHSSSRSNKHVDTRERGVPASDKRAAKTASASHTHKQQARANTKRHEDSASGAGRKRSVRSAPARGERAELTRSRAHAASVLRRGPSIVRHQVSGSRQLLRQLDKLRKLSGAQGPAYKVRRPAKEARVEALIDQLEHAADEWERDEHLLERAEWHEAALRQRSLSVASLASLSSSSSSSSSWLSLELKSSSSNASGGEQAEPGAALRQDRRREPVGLETGEQQQQQQAQRPQMSYLLCEPTAELPASEPGARDSWRHRNQDDMHYRRHLRRSPEPIEPPLGVPRQPANQSVSMVVARRPDSRVSFADEQRGSRARSATPVAQSSPVLGARANSLIGLRPISSGSSPSPQQPLAVYHHQQAIDEQMRRQTELVSDETDIKGCDGGADELELVRAEICATPSRQRPRFAIERPRAKSPLLRASTPMAGSSGRGTSQSMARDDESPTYSSYNRRSYETTSKSTRTRNGHRNTSTSRQSASSRTSELECKHEFYDDVDELGTDSEDRDSELDAVRRQIELHDAGLASQKPSRNQHQSHQQRRGHVSAPRRIGDINTAELEPPRGFAATTANRPASAVSARTLTTTPDSAADAGHSDNSSSLERLDYRAGRRSPTPPPAGSRPSSASPRFSIGQYKSLDRSKRLTII